MSDSFNRRDVMRAAGTVGAGALGVSAAAGTATARDYRSPDEMGGVFVEEAALERQPEEPPAWYDQGALEEDPPIRYEQRDHRGLPGYTYMTSIHAGDVCLMVSTSCFMYTVAATADMVPGDEVAVAGACGAVGGGCLLRGNLKRHVGYSFDWVHIYRASWWNRMNPATPNHLLMPDSEAY